VGGVAGTVLPDGVISPGGIGFDINCGVRLLARTSSATSCAPKLEAAGARDQPQHPGRVRRGGRLGSEPGGARSPAHRGLRGAGARPRPGLPEDLDFIESRGTLPGADAAAVSDRAKERGRDQVGTLGGGNHFLEVQMVETVYDERAAAAMGLRQGLVTVLVHSGSRGLGHQVCTDYVRRWTSRWPRHGITLPDRQLACAPLSSREGQALLRRHVGRRQLRFCNRQAIAHRVREVFRRVVGRRARAAPGLRRHPQHRQDRAARPDASCACTARGPPAPSARRRSELAPAYRGVGQPVLIPGSMGTASFVLVGTDQASELSLSSCCHGAGRAMSRSPPSAPCKAASCAASSSARASWSGCPCGRPSLGPREKARAGLLRDVRRGWCLMVGGNAGG
jgi:tRNA-splicing ligase RtcB